MGYPKTLRDLIECFKKLPSVGEKSAERMALATLNIDQDQLDLFAESLKKIKKNLKRCSKCNNFSEEDECDICKDKNRDLSILCVVEEPKNVILFERVGTFSGRYHILDGLISPLDGVKPENLKIDLLIDRVKKEKIKEIVIALKPSIEGETTALYICKLFEGKDVTISKIAHGVPMGAEMDYLDSLTLEMALEDRKKISE